MKKGILANTSQVDCMAMQITYGLVWGMQLTQGYCLACDAFHLNFVVAQTTYINNSPNDTSIYWKEDEK